VDLLEAMRQRHFYASDDWNAEASLTLNSQPMGTIFSGAIPATVQVNYSDPDAEAITSLTLMSGVPGSGSAPVAVATAAAGATALSYTDNRVAGLLAYYYAVIVQADGDRIVTSPIWYARQVVTAMSIGLDPLALTVFPNPTAGAAVLSYFLPTAATVSADNYDVAGRHAATITAGERQAAGPHVLAIPTLRRGVYVVRLLHEGTAEYRKLLVN
jgi:hypothetical protein